MIYATARLLSAGGISIRLVLTFFMFLWGTFSCLAFLADLAMFYPPFGWDLNILMYIHPLVGMVSIIYLLEFVHRQAALERWKSALVVVFGYFVVLASRAVFIP